MPTTRLDGFEHAIHTTNIWVNTVAEALGTDDRHYTYRVLRAWLHTLRDRLTVDVAAHFAAQLPELLRGVYYDGWDPSAVPIKYDREAFVQHFAREARTSVDDAPRTVAAITVALREHFSAGQLETVLQQFPQDVRDLLQPAGRTRR